MTAQKPSSKAVRESAKPDHSQQRAVPAGADSGKCESPADAVLGRKEVEDGDKTAPPAKPRKEAERSIQELFADAKNGLVQFVRAIDKLQDHDRKRYFDIHGDWVRLSEKLEAWKEESC